MFCFVLSKPAFFLNFWVFCKSEDIVENNHIYISLQCDLELKDSRANFLLDTASWWCIIIRGLATKCKKTVQEIVARQIFMKKMLNLCCDCDLENSKTIFSQDILAYDYVPSTHIWSQKNQRFERCDRKSCVLIIQAMWPWPWRQQPIFLHNTLVYDDVLSLVTKGSEDIVGTNIN